MSNSDINDALPSIAIIGMSGRFPGARNLRQFWQNLSAGVESITFFSDEELIESGVDPALLSAPNFVKASGALDDVEYFDAAFFGLSPREAEIMDPQYRFFLETTWEALEDAGYYPDNYEGVIGIYGGMGMNKYLLNNLITNRDLVESEGALQLRILNDKDFLSSLTAYKLNLKGPSITVQAACSTSLVATCLAVQSLLNYQCDIALAGGVSISSPAKTGYFPQEGVFSANGQCRAFDASAAGTVSGNGVGVVVLKRLEDAVADGDRIRAVIKGAAVNNDGSLKVGYTAPSVEGQAEVIAMAQALARVNPETITYIETHGTATPLGDPIEIASLTQVFRLSTDKKKFCAIGSLKTNIGHLDAAAGVASLIKTVMSLENKMLPPSLHFKQPNPQIDFDNSPFYVNAQLSEWKPNGGPCRAGVSTFAVGGVNAHVIVEEAPRVEPSGPSRDWQLLTLSARTDSALETLTDNLVVHSRENPDQNLADIAYTLQIGRAGFAHRRVLVCRNTSDAADSLGSRDPRRVFTHARAGNDSAVAFMFPGLGNHYVNMGLELYRSEPRFREQIDRCCEILEPHLGLNLRDILYPEWQTSARQSLSPASRPRLDLRKMIGRQEENDESANKLNQTYLTQPALFVIEYALAKLWMSWGIKPQAMIGYSIGEYVAACLAGVFSLEDALLLVARRAAMIQQLPGGSMLAVPLAEQEVKLILNGNLSLAAVNGSSICVVAGPTPDISELEHGLAARGLACRRLQTSHAFHSKMMEPIQDSFTRLIESIKLLPPEIPFLSNATGGWITPAQATDPSYWTTHMSRTVRFEEGVGELLKEPDRVLLEVGPGQALGAWAMQHSRYEDASGQRVFASLRHSYDEQSDTAFLLNTLGKLWLAGLRVDWKAFYADEKRHHVSLPTYPFERKRYWISPGNQTYQVSAPQKAPGDRKNVAEWFYFPAWKQTKPLALSGTERLVNDKQRWLVFVDECGLGSLLVERLRSLNQDVITVEPGEHFTKLAEGAFQINPAEQGDYETLLAELKSLGKSPETIIHLWGVTFSRFDGSRIARAEKSQQMGFFSLLSLAQALGNRNPDVSLHLGIVSNNAQSVTGEEELQPEKATSLGPSRVIPHEYQTITCQSLDIVFPGRSAEQEKRLVDCLLEEFIDKPSESLVAYRGGNRWALSYESLPLDDVANEKTRLREGGVYLITGGMGGIGLVLADYLARAVRAKLALVARSRFPEKEEWGDWLLTHSGEDEVSRKIRKLRNLEAQGAEVLVLRADVTNVDQMRDAVATVRESFGEINGVIHAAGVSPGGMIQIKARETAASVLAPKVTGTLILDELLRETEPDFIIFCSSLASILGGFGLVDHCGANAFLDSFARSNSQRSKTLMLSINWDAWLEVGQAANAELSLGLKEILQKPVYSAVNHPLLEKSTVDQSGQEIYLSEFSTAKQWILDEHRIMDNGVVPGTAYIEMIRKAFEAHAGDSPILLRKLIFMSPIIVKDGDTRQVQTIIDRDGDGFRFRVLSEDTSAANVPVWQEHVTGKVELADAESPKRYNIAEILNRCEKEIVVEEIADYSHEVEESRKRKSLNLGRRWQNLLKKINVGQDEVLAYLELPEEFAGDLESFKIHPSLLDAATGIVQAVGEALFLPLGYEKLKIWSPLQQRIYSHIRAKEGGFADKDTIACDIVIMDEQGTELIHAEDYIIKKVRNVDALAQVARAQSESPSPGIAVEVRQDEGEEQGSAAGFETGISPGQGVEAFERILSSGVQLPQVIVSTRDFHSLIEQSGVLTRARILEEIGKLQSRRQKHARPNVSTQFVAPRNDVENKLADIWRETLSVEEVGIYDNFFELGGDSLLATQLISRLSETFYIDLSLRTLFEVPTVIDLAVLIVQKQAEKADDQALAEMLAEIKQLSQAELQASLSAEKNMTSD